MAAIANSFDRILQASVPRFAAPTDRAFFVSPEQAIFTVTNGIASPSSFNFTPTLLNMAGAVTYVPSAGVAISVSGNNFSLDYSNLTVSAGTVVATLVVDGVTYTRTIRVSRIFDGIAPKILDLAASSQVFQINKAGVGSPGSIELVAKGQNLTGTPNFTIVSGTATLTIGADNTRKQLTLPNMETDTVTVQVAQDGQVDTVTIVKVREGTDGTIGANGANGSPAVTAFMTNEAQAVPASLDGSVISMAGATTTMKVFLGISDDSANWTYTATPPSAANAIIYTLGAASGVLTATNLADAVDSAYVDITASRNGYASVTKRFSLAKSKTGATGAAGSQGIRGNVNLSIITSGSAWSDAEANAAVVSMTGTAARSRDVVNLYRADRTWAQKRIFDGFNWSILADVFDGSIFVKGSVLAEALDTRGLTVKALDGTVLLGVGVPLAASLAAPGTLNGDIVIGGRNLYSRTQSFSDPTSSGSIVAERYPAVSGDAFTLIGNNQGSGFQRMAIPNLKIGPYTLSFNLRLRDGAGNLWVDLADTTTQKVSQSTTDTHYEFHFLVTNAGLAWLDFDQMNAQGYYFSQFKLEAGNKATTYTPSPDDVSADTVAVKVIADATKAFADAVANDGILDRSEKAQLVAKWQGIEAERARLVPAAASLGVSSVAYYAAYQALSDYLVSISPGWSDTAQDSPIVRATFNVKFTAYADAWQSLQNAMDSAPVTLNSSVNLGPTGILNGAGGGQMTALATIDRGNGSVFGARNRNDAPNDYPVGTTKQFKQRTALVSNDGISPGGTETYCTLETIKQYLDASGGGIYQYAYIANRTWRRYGGNPQSTDTTGATWFPWVQDLDRAAYTGDLNATYGGTLGVNIAGQITAANALQLVGSNAITNSMFGGDLLSIDWNGRMDSLGTGWAIARSGKIYCTNLAARGSVAGSAFNENYAWPSQAADGSWPGGFHLSASGLLLGNGAGGGKYFQVTAGGDMYMPGFNHVNGQLTLTNTILIAPRIGDSMTLSVTPGNGQYYTMSRNAANQYTSNFTATGGGMDGAFRYAWSFEQPGGSARINIAGTGNQTVNPQIIGNGQVGELDFYFSCTATHISSGATRRVDFFLTVNFT